MNYEPLIEGIAKLVGAAGKVAEKSAGKAAEGVGHTPVDVERWLGPLSAPEKQVPIIHDYLRGSSALEEAKATGATHVRDISVPVWESAQRRLQSQVDADPEVQQALRNMYVGRNTPRDPDVTTVAEKPEAPSPEPVSVEVPKETPQLPQAKAPRRVQAEKLSVEQKKQQADAWNEFTIGVESQDGPRIDKALERIRALHPETEPANPAGTVTQTPGWQKALDYMGALEQQVQQMGALKVQSEDWSKMLDNFRETQGIDQTALPKHIRNTVDRFEAWADAQKPPSAIDRVGEALGVPRALMSSADLSAPGRQGLLMISRPEYWQHLKTMAEAWNPEKFAESQRYIREHPDLPAAQEAGLAITDVHSKLQPREEAFQSQLAEKIPVIGPIVKGSEQAYTTFLNRLRLDVFSNEMKMAAAAGVDVSDKKFLNDLAEWINTSTGRGGGKKFNVGVLSSVLFSPRLAISRFQTFNPQYYWKLHPYVRAQAIKSNLAAAALVVSLVSLAGLGGAKVTWDFRDPDAGKVRIGNTRLDLGGGHLQFLRLFTQIARNQTVNPDTGKVTELGGKFGAPTRLDLLTRFLISKEAPIPSFVTDWMRADKKHPFNLTNEAISRVAPLAVQDTYDALKDKGIEGLFYAIPAAVGVGLQTYGPPSAGAPTVPFVGVKGEVPPERAAEFTKLMEQADSVATANALMKTKNMSPAAAKAVTRAYVKAERTKARIAWIRANKEAYVQAKKAGEQRIPLQAPGAP